MFEAPRKSRLAIWTPLATIGLALNMLSVDVGCLLAAPPDTAKTQPGVTTDKGSSNSVQAPTPTVPSLDGVEAVGVYDVSTPRDTAPTRAGIDDRIVVHVRNLRSLASRAACLSLDEKPVSGCTPQKIALYLDGREIKDLIPESGAPEIGQQDGDLHFHIQRSPASDEAWADLLGSPQLGPYFFTRPTRLSVGLQSGFALRTQISETKFELLRIRERRFWFAAVALLVLLFGIVRIATRTNLLRDTGPSYPVARRVGGTLKVEATLKPYSLARCQMAFWFVLTVGAFVFIYLITGASDTITNSVLALLGISAGTFLGAAVIDAGAEASSAVDGTNVKERVATLETTHRQRAELESEIARVTKQIEKSSPGEQRNALAATRTHLETKRDEATALAAEIDEQIATAPVSARPRVSRHFLTDILGDSAEPGFHRFQIFVWTIVLGVLFVIGVWSRVAMPDFSATLLGLLGISSGTYLGFKFPEAKA